MAKKICIVTPDIVGPMKNGGIGTACYWLALILARNGYAVTALYTGPFQNSTFHEVRARYAEHGVDFQAISELKMPNNKYFGMEYFGILSDRIYTWLKRQSFDVIHFQDWQGNAFSSVQAKKLGIAFQHTKLVLALHSPSLWEREGMKIWPRDPIVDGRLDYMEKYSIENADSVWAPSHAMLDWIDSHGMKPKAKTRVLRYLINLDAEEKQQSYFAKDPSHVIFFGRLETRKGLELFCSAMTKVLSSGKEHGIRRLSFLGKVGSVQNSPNAASFLKDQFEKWKEHGIDCKIHDNLDAFQAIRFIQKTGGIAVMPSLLDNYPYTVLECIQNQVPCLAAATGGIPEMLAPEVVFEPKADALCTVLLERTERIKAMRGLYSSEETRKAWLEYSTELEADIRPEESELKEISPRVSICVAYYNYGRYLPQLLLSLTRNEYANFEVIVVNDGSTDPFSIQVFEQQKQELSHLGWKFLSHQNQGIGATRNFAASQASGEFIIFMDADNVAAPNMIATFVKAITTSGADALTCIGTVFQGDDYPGKETEVYYLYRPIGPILELGMMENVFGDANAIIRKTAFDGIKGFRTDRSTSYEDWEFFALLALNGYKLDVVPEQLFYYRHQGEGFSRVTSMVQNQQRVLRAYYAHADKIDLERLINNFVAPLYHLRATMSGMIMAQQAKALAAATPTEK